MHQRLMTTVSAHRVAVVAMVLALVASALGPTVGPVSADTTSVSISKTTNAGGTRSPGDAFAYTITVTTHAPVERLVVADGAFDYPQISITSATASINGAPAAPCAKPRPDNAWCAAGNLGAGSSVVVTVNVKVDPNVNVACDKPGQHGTEDSVLRNIAKARWQEAGTAFIKESAPVSVNLNCTGYDPDALPSPTVDIFSGPSATTTSTSATFGFTASPTANQFRCAIDGNSYVSCTSPKTYANLALGSHYVDIQGRNTTGWGVATRWSWTIGSPFTDIGSSAFKNDILWLYNAGITGGCSATKFCPKANVTREQMASFLARALKLPATTTDFFGDDNSSIHEGDINRLAAAGVTGGCDTGRFCPKSNVTREQMASFLARAFKLPGTTADFFADDETSIHESSINRLAASGITGGCGTGRYCPRANVTREQMAAFLHRAMTR
jgi:hypothetical protein